MLKRKKYVTVSKNDDALDYRTIANIMSSNGDKMNHATVRNIILKSFYKIAKGVAGDYEKKLSDEQLKIIAKSPQFQTAIIELMREKNE
tara:strand:+ start:338 stop:604 length:267 start_codon:yes stop_codon:yes gene_type:complete